MGDFTKDTLLSLDAMCYELQKHVRQEAALIEEKESCIKETTEWINKYNKLSGDYRKLKEEADSYVSQAKAIIDETARILLKDDECFIHGDDGELEVYDKSTGLTCAFEQVLMDRIDSKYREEKEYNICEDGEDIPSIPHDVDSPENN